MKSNNRKELKTVLIILSFVLIILSAYLVCHYCKVERHPTYFNSDNYLIIEDRPFFPIGIYSVNPLKQWDPPSAFEELKVAGFNAVHTYESDYEYLKKYVEKAKDLELKVLLFPGARIKIGRNIIDNEMGKVKNAVKDLKDSLAILSWYLCDEPDGQKISPGQLNKEMDLIHELDSKHPTAIVVADPKKFDDYTKATDILMVDPYPVPHHPLTKVAESVDLARKATKDKKPVWAVLQAFGYQNEKRKGWGWEREPTFEEMKAMTYLAIARGARGIFYYTYHGSQYFVKDSPGHWEDLKTIVRELREIYPILVAPEAGNVVIDISEMEDERASFFWTIRQVTEGNSLIQPGTYLIVANGTNCSGRATFMLDGGNTGNVKLILEERHLECNEGHLTDHFEPHEVHIYNLGQLSLLR